MRDLKNEESRVEIEKSIVVEAIRINLLLHVMSLRREERGDSEGFHVELVLGQAALLGGFESNHKVIDRLDDSREVAVSVDQQERKGRKGEDPTSLLPCQGWIQLQQKLFTYVFLMIRLDIPEIENSHQPSPPKPTN